MRDPARGESVVTGVSGSHERFDARSPTSTGPFSAPVAEARRNDTTHVSVSNGSTRHRKPVGRELEDEIFGSSSFEKTSP
jgi:hypothetical protein